MLLFKTLDGIRLLSGGYRRISKHVVRTFHLSASSVKWTEKSPCAKTYEVCNMNMFSNSAARVFVVKAKHSFLRNASVRCFASVGDKLPAVELHHGFPPKKHNLAEYAKNKSILLVGLPGAFTPT
ncbi:predicted protein [Phaeodactylum tricornutum CCAP 1055/1]|jgi:hypothetical protein|uniref:Uncharacterized protein n=2 Tax=Phaeodactylum tricornutum TaxID=2850 RepID=B7G594_PHATC|nr:predicted protein [Phaeodactylum tricornutum CCAP 1055/1]EEC46278.1 predicted protein [Phaeodactylum tricornutum CCAP 1055/1]|eukprot:XP_002182377.1 predicted protein [Phaeodactylum tricornutum CCAP 1055/1]